MKVRKSAAFVVSSAVAAALLAAAIMLLIRDKGRLAAARADLAKGQKKLDSYYVKDPFPSRENVAAQQASARELQSRFDALMQTLREGQTQPEERSPSNFIRLLGDKCAELRETGRRHGVELPANFTFGFGRYLGEGSGALPAPDHVPRLMEQLAIVDTLCALCVQQGVTAIDGIQRDEFEGPREGERPPPGTYGESVRHAGLLREGDLFTRLRFVLDLRVRERALVGVLNDLARHRMFMVVKHVEIQKQSTDVKTAAETRGTTEADREKKPADMTRQERIVSGVPVEAPMRVRVVVEVYRFRAE
jgi:hypothetical protein